MLLERDSNGKVELTCQKCGNLFRTRSKRQKFCSKKCYWLSKRRRIAVTCDLCGADFEVTPSQLEKGEDKHCSLECYNRHRAEGYLGDGTKIERQCRFCEHSFRVSPSVTKYGWGIYCSRRCQDAARIDGWSGENNPRWNGGIQTQVCDNCGTRFQKYSCFIRKFKFCSYECYIEWQTSDLWRGENNPNWKGGLSFEPYPLSFNAQFKKTVRERDQYICVVCRRLGKAVHHIDYDKQNTTLDNCVTLCNSCHSLTNTKRGYWQAALEELMKKRYSSSGQLYDSLFVTQEAKNEYLIG